MLSRCLSPAAGLLVLAGCAGSGSFPSLAPRAVEQAAVEKPTTPASTPAAAIDPEVARQIAAIVTAAESGHRSFLDELAAARSTILGASGASPGSERWVAAQQAYSRAESARGPLTSALADLDALRRARIDMATPAELVALDQAAQQIGALEAQESTSLSDLAAKLG